MLDRAHISEVLKTAREQLPHLGLLDIKTFRPENGERLFPWELPGLPGAVAQGLRFLTVDALK